MTRDIAVFNSFLKQFGIYREFYRELRLAQPSLSRIKDEEIEFSDFFSSKDYIICSFDWTHTLRGPYFWSLMNDTWKAYRIKNL